MATNIQIGKIYTSGDSEVRRKVLAITNEPIPRVKYLIVKHYDKKHIGSEGEMKLMAFQRWALELLANSNA